MSKATGVFQFMVPVVVYVDNGAITSVNVDDGTAVTLANSTHISGNSLKALVRAANADDDWPAWEFGF